METEMSMQSDIVPSNSDNKSKSISSYSKVETKDEEEEYYIDPKDIQLGIDSTSKSKNSIYPVNSDKLLPISIEQRQNYFYKKLGNTYSFFGDIYGNPKIIIGPHWPLYAVVTSFFSFFYFVIMYFLGKKNSFFLNFIGFLIYFTFVSSYSYTALINPGYPKHDIDSVTGEPRKKFYYCSTCKMWVNREKKTLHCSDCNICVEGMDHHCPWTGKCIGSKNLISFYVFVFSLFLLIGFYACPFIFMDKSSLSNEKK